MKRLLTRLGKRLKSFGRPKIFCIGLNKTGTTTLAVTMRELGVPVGNQREAELLFDDWRIGDYSRIIKYCHTARFFQDSPFSYPHFYKELDRAFPGSLFILSVRDNAEQWCGSITRFHGKLFGKDGRVPTREDLENSTYISKGRVAETMKAVFNTPVDDPYNREVLIEVYNRHLHDVTEYFKGRPDDLLVLNVANPSDYSRLCDFIGKAPLRTEFPWSNKT